MLTQIHIRNLATIGELALNFSRGTTMITGETGAGKSIFIEAIELALGGRASPNLIRPGKEKAEITLCFDVSNFPNVIAALTDMDLYQDIPECIIRRVITIDGRSRCYVNGTPSTVYFTKELGEQLFHLHSQHQQQILLNGDTQREMLDRYGDHLELCSEVRKLAEAFKHVQGQLKKLHAEESTRTERLEYLRYQLNELQAINLKEGEWEQLETELHKLTHAEELIKIVNQSINCIAGEEGPQVLLSGLDAIRKSIESIQSYEPQAAQWLTAIHSIHIQLNDLEAELRNYLECCEPDPQKLQRTEERVSQIFNLARKYKMSPQTLTDYQTRLANELILFDSCEENMAKLLAEQAIILKTYQAKAQQLTASRAATGLKLEKEITKIIRALSLPHSEFKIAFEAEKQAGILHWQGNERVFFLIKTNPDQVLQALNKVVSGGELSRLSLAAHLTLASKTNIPTLVFDEVDTGLSGATAEKIGKLLRKLGKAYQVFCITHQAQVAAYGNHHLLVEKTIANQKTHTGLRLLDYTNKAKEIARMLGGEKITQKTLDHAKEILESV